MVASRWHCSANRFPTLTGITNDDSTLRIVRTPSHTLRPDAGRFRRVSPGFATAIFQKAKATTRRGATSKSQCIVDDGMRREIHQTQHRNLFFLSLIVATFEFIYIFSFLFTGGLGIRWRRWDKFSSAQNTPEDKTTPRGAEYSTTSLSTSTRSSRSS